MNASIGEDHRDAFWWTMRTFTLTFRCHFVVDSLGSRGVARR